MADFDKRDFDICDFNILVAKCGKSIGLKGEIRLIVYSDFDEIWQKGNVFLCKGDSAWDSSLQSNSNATISSLRGRIADSHEAIQKNKIDCHDFATQNLAMTENGAPCNDDDSAFFLTLKSFNPHKQSAFFSEINSVDEAKNLTSMLLYSSEFLTQKYCVLGENEHFWFEIVGMSVVDNGEIVGAVSDIERIGSVDYLLVATNQSILAKYPHIKAKKFYIPYIPRYIVRIDKNANAIQSPPQTRKDSPKGTIFVRDSLGILEES